ncbi:acetyl-CoA C-acetyltransferase, partial [Microbacterium sp. HSID17254]|uniref:thiolase family protein n=1 Tax=Microbacterium sp. HSID17254 TaxID=2419509 RepID=UPI000FA00BAC
DVAVAGGVESMTRVPMFSSSQGQDPLGSAFAARYGVAPTQGAGAEVIAEKWGFSRTQLDEFALLSHARAAEAQDDGRFAGQIAPVAGVSTDEGVRRGGTLEGLAQLKTVFKEADQGGVIHAGNSSQISDGAAALLMTTSEKAGQLGRTPIARVHTGGLAGADPVIMLSAPSRATDKALTRSALPLDAIGPFQVNQAFAPLPLAWLADTAGADS